jgi:hypothetical protein
MTTRGSCLCGAVRYTVDGPLRNVMACHCTQCRKQSGHYVAAAAAPRDAVAIEGADAITWFEASPGIRRGFCRICGSHLFWDDPAQDSLSLNSGALEKPTGIRLEGHIFCADKGDYYEITDDLPQHAAYPER